MGPVAVLLPATPPARRPGQVSPLSNPSSISHFLWGSRLRGIFSQMSLGTHHFQPRFFKQKQVVPASQPRFTTECVSSRGWCVGPSGEGARAQHSHRGLSVRSATPGPGRGCAHLPGANTASRRKTPSWGAARPPNPSPAARAAQKEPGRPPPWSRGRTSQSSWIRTTNGKALIE